MGKSPRVIVIGDAFVDILACIGSFEIANGSDNLAESIQLLAGGSGLNTSCKIKELKGDEIEVHFFSAIGDHDDQGKFLMNKLIRANVIPHLLQPAGSVTGSCIVLSTKTERSFITTRGVIDEFKAADFANFDNDSINKIFFTSKDKKRKRRAEDESIVHVHCAGYYNCSGLQKDIKDVFRKAHKYNYSTSLNPQCDASGEYSGIVSLCDKLTYLFANEEEIMAMAKMHTNVIDYTAKMAAMIFIEAGCECVVITRGAAGVTCYFGNSELEAKPPSLHEDVVDTTGAGDAFISGFLAVIAEYDPRLSKSGEFNSGILQEALRLGCLMGAHCCTEVGGSTFAKEKLDRLLAHAKK